MNNNACGALKARCGASASTDNGGGGTAVDAGLPDIGVFSCPSACDALNGRMCITADQHSACRSKCGSAPRSTRETFVSCSHMSSDCASATRCVTTFEK